MRTTDIKVFKLLSIAAVLSWNSFALSAMDLGILAGFILIVAAVFVFVAIYYTMVDILGM